MNKILPRHWELIELGDFCNMFYGKSLLTKELVNDGFPVYGANGIIGAFSDYMFEDSKLLISSRGSMSGITHITLPKSYVTSNSIVIESLVPKITNEYLKFAIDSTEKNNIITGSAQPQITIQNLRRLKIPIPPIDEQKQIVSLLNKSLNKIDSFKTARESIPQAIIQIRKKIIDDAVKGKLSRNFRNKLVNYKKSSELVEELISIRIKDNPKVKLSKKIIPNSQKLQIPETWTWSKLINIADVVGGITKGKKIISNETILLPYLRVANVQDGYLDLSSIKYIEALPADLSKYKLQRGDILFTEGGDRDKLGRGTVWNDEIYDCIHQNHIFRARTNPNYINPYYIGIYTKSETAKEYFFNNASQTVNLASINLTALSNISIPIPPIDEQNYICQKVNNLLQELIKISESHNKFCGLLNRIERLIFVKAFNGDFSYSNVHDNDTKHLIENIKDFAVNFKAKSQRKNLPNHKEQSSENKENLIKVQNNISMLVKNVNSNTSNTKIKSNKQMKVKPVETYNELIECLEKLGGEAYPEALLIAASLEDDVDLFYDLLRDARDNEIVIVPVGHIGKIKKIRNEIN
ncbi:restriction endonuclease subunit S [Flavobacterium sp. ACN6]|uniref:restriction endonuclease subunit S n=1 Tax=Flavobacterium sp. ACN6 TaxID=1920426 RepID=UPI0015522472|nr:restriction endonuclease subunit S [Flavobacterium sp. ACN6]